MKQMLPSFEGHIDDDYMYCPYCADGYTVSSKLRGTAFHVDMIDGQIHLLRHELKGHKKVRTT